MTLEKGNALTLDGVLPAVQERIDVLLQTCSALKSRIEKAPAGTLGGYDCHSYWQWYRTLEKGGAKMYLSRNKKELIKQLAQKKYESMVLDEVYAQLSVLDHFVECYKPQKIQGIFDSLDDRLQKLVERIPMSNESFGVAWQSKKYRGKKFSINAPMLLTSGGVRVRSKSEIIIAEELASMGVPFKYEFPYVMDWYCEGVVQKGPVYPDFTCLNVKTRKEFIWEHFGMMDDADYVNGAVEKLENYERNGFSIGENLIISMETMAKPMIPDKARSLIKKYLI